MCIDEERRLRKVTILLYLIEDVRPGGVEGSKITLENSYLLDVPLIYPYDACHLLSCFLPLYSARFLAFRASRSLKIISYSSWQYVHQFSLGHPKLLAYISQLRRLSVFAEEFLCFPSIELT